jgi:hypothetical protein
MAYTEFTLESVESAFGLTSRPAGLFPGLRPIAVPDWLRDYLSRGQQTAVLVSEKARSEFLVVPILMAARELTTSELSIYSGQRLDVDPARGLVGECDYILALTPPVPRLKAPLVTVLEAKKGDLESALGQCVAQMMGAHIFNERTDQGHLHLYGCVTSGEVWQFLRLEGSEVGIDRVRFFLDNVGGILAAIQMILMRSRDALASGPSPTVGA